MPTTVPVVPDTVQIRVAVPDSLPQPDSVFVVQDTLIFGGFLHVVMDYNKDHFSDDPSNATSETWLPNLETDGQWLAAANNEAWSQQWDNAAGIPELDLSGSQAVTGRRIVQSFRVYRRDPLQIIWQDKTSRVLFVRGQTAGMDKTATIRQPRPLSWTPWRLILAALVVFAVLVLIYGWWRRRQRPAPLEHWQLPDPAWLALAVGLQKLIAENVLAKGESRKFLDRLAALTREYVAERYRIAAREMTGEEIVNACQKLGHELVHPRGFASLIKVSDRERYNPDEPALPLCREQAVQVFRRVEKVRLQSQFVAVAAAKQIAADQAWTALVRELGDPAQDFSAAASVVEVS